MAYSAEKADDQISLSSDNDEPHSVQPDERSDAMIMDDSDDLTTFETQSNACIEASTSLRSSGRQRRKHSLKNVPAELLQQVATQVANDSDLRSLNLSSTIFAHTVSPHESAVWRQRFLAKYDFPVIESSAEFAVAYKLRQFILNNFVSFEGDETEKMKVQLEVILDMITETYNRERRDLPWPMQSRNLAILQSVDQSSYMTKLLGCPLYAGRSCKYGKSFPLFESIQLVLSYLVLSYKSPFTTLITTSRGSYDLVKVYLFNQPFKPLYGRLPVVIGPDNPSSGVRYRLARVRTRARTRGKSTWNYSLDLNSLLHIRNFWQRHLTDDIRGLGENTYAGMSKALMARNSYPRPWSRPLHLPAKVAHVWHGMYSSLDPWPKNRNDLEERQSSAEEWDAVDPMKIEFISSTHNESSLWPPSFGKIPAFRQTIPRGKNAEQLNCVYLRGTAPFMNISEVQSKSDDDKAGDHGGILLKYHPFTAARVRGVIHDISEFATSDQITVQTEKQASRKGPATPKPSISGWKRIVMIMYKTYPQYLNSVLEHALEEYGVPSAEAAYNTADLWNDATDSDSDSHSQDSDPDTNANTDEETSPSPSAITSDPNQPSTEPGPGPGRHSRALKHLAKLIHQYTKKYRRRQHFQTGLPALFSPEHINQLEDSFMPSAYLSWDDELTQIIDYAYAYEGIIIPGGQIMMGRWWRVHGADGLGPGREIGTGGVGVKVRRVKDREVQKQAEDGAENGDGDEVMRDGSSDEEESEGTSVGNARDDGVGDGRKVEFITQVNGEETRAVNGCKGLERGPFIFWASETDSD